MTRLRKVSFGLALEQTLADLAGEAFLRLAKASVKSNHPLGVEGIFSFPTLLSEKSNDEIILSRNRLHQVKTPLLPL